jgi:uncharacterized membrane protein
MKSLARCFAQGLIVLLPIVTTIAVLTWAFRKLDDLFPVQTPGLSFVAALATVLFVGWLTSLILGRWAVRVTDWVARKIPLVSWLYGTVKDVVQAFGGNRKLFDRPVVVSLFDGGAARMLGFVTCDDLGALGLPGEVAVLLQQSLGFAGNLVVVPKSRVQALQVPSGEFLKFVLSGGVAGRGAKVERDAFPRIGDATAG